MTQIDLRIDLTPTQLNAWAIIKPLLKAYLAKIFRIYRNAPDDKKDELRAHNPILNQILDALGE